jgi:hypothetical protein
MKTILILLSNPKDSVQLRLGEEIREIKAALKQSKNRDQFKIVSESAVRVQELRRTLLEDKPIIVHFSGHGAGSDGLILENDAGETQFVSSEALAKLFKQFQQEVQCVILNACYSEEQAQAIHQHIDCVIGMNQAVGDEAAIHFSTAFYEALGAGKAYDECFNFARSSIDLEGIPESDTPQIRYRPRHYISDIQETQTVSKKEDSSARTPSQSFGNINSSGKKNPFNAINSNKGDINIDQSYNQTIGQNSKIEVVLNQLQQLKQEIAITNALKSIQKKQVVLPIEMIETELNKSQPDKSLIDEAVEALKQGLEGVETLAKPVMKVAEILATAWV